MARRVVKQLELHLPMWGGRREGAGRKRRSPRDRVAHARRPVFCAAHPVQITMRVCEVVPSLRERPAWVAIVRTLRALRERAGFRVVHYAVMTNHIHAIVEGDDAGALVGGMRALTVRLALRLNRAWGRRGRVFDHRYHARELQTPREVWLSLQYVLLNARKHAAEGGVRLPPEWIDRCSSAACFDGWQRPPALARAGDFGTSPPSTWLLHTGWRCHGLLRLDATPGERLRGSAMAHARRQDAPSLDSVMDCAVTMRSRSAA